MELMMETNGNEKKKKNERRTNRRGEQENLCGEPVLDRENIKETGKREKENDREEEKRATSLFRLRICKSEY